MRAFHRSWSSASTPEIVPKVGDSDYAKAVLVTPDWLAEHLNDPDVVVAEVDEHPDRHLPGAGEHALVDVRSPQEYSGDLIAPPGYEQEGAQRGGHIPTAASIPWAQAVRDDGTFKSAADPRELYSSRGVTGDKSVTAYCRIGERSAHTWFVLHELLGFDDVKNY